MTEAVKKSADIQQAVDKIADWKIEQTEAEHIKKVAENINQDDINEFFNASEYKKTYEQALNTIIQSLENYKKKNTDPTWKPEVTIPKNTQNTEQPKPLEFTFATPNKQQLENDVINFIEKLQKEKEKNKLIPWPVVAPNQVNKVIPESAPNSSNAAKENTKTEIQKFDDFLIANNIEGKFTDIFQETKESFRSIIMENISEELLKSKRLTEKREDGATVLNKLWNETYGLIEKKLSDKRMGNLTYSILNKLLEEAKKKIWKSNGNADVEIQEKAYLFMAMKNIITPKQKTNSTEKPELKGISSDAAERIWAMVQPSTDLATIEKNLSTFIKDQLKAWGFDIEKPWKSIRKAANESKTSINEAIPTVISDAFDYAFSYLNNTQWAEALLNWLLVNDKNKAFDPSKIKKEWLDLETQTTPTGDQLSALAKV